MKQKIWMILCCVGLTFLLSWWLWSAFHIQQNKLCSESSLIFADVIQKEKIMRIKRQTGRYDSESSPNKISGAEKNEWCDQDFLFYRDSTRALLDSLFRATLLEHDVHAKTAIRCVRRGLIIHTSSDSTFYKEALPLKQFIYRVDENPDRDITLQAYIKLPFITVWRHGYLMWMISGLGLLLLAAVIVGCRFWFRKIDRITKQELQLQQEKQRQEQELQDLNQKHEFQRIELQRLHEQQRLDLQRQREALQQQKQQQQELQQLESQQQIEFQKQHEQQRQELQCLQEKLLQQQQQLQEKEEQLPSLLIQNKTIKWIELSQDLFFNDEHGDLCYKNEVNILLTENSLKLFRCFIKAEQHKLTYKKICIEILGRLVKNEPSKSDRDAAANTIRHLRAHLCAIPVIQIESIRGTGYQMIILSQEGTF